MIEKTQNSIDNLDEDKLKEYSNQKCFIQFHINVKDTRFEIGDFLYYANGVSPILFAVKLEPGNTKMELKMNALETYIKENE